LTANKLHRDGHTLRLCRGPDADPPPVAESDRHSPNEAAMFEVGWQGTRPGTPSGHRRAVSSPHDVNYEGRSLGGFHIAHEIACGGMGRVFLAHRVQHERVGQTAAVKLIHPHLAREAEFINMFLDEARIVSSVNHPNVCRILDFGQADGTYYLAMEYVMGESLADVMTHLHLTRETEWMAEPLMKYALHQVCEALYAVHQAEDGEGKPLGIIHRDISPHNIMIGYDGCVRVLDFGVARASEREQVTRTGVVKGRFAYMAPEQMRGLAIDPRADLWSVGAVLWEGLTGRRLFKRETDAQTIMAVTLDAIPPATHPRHAVPASLQRVVARALERDPSRRYDTARDLGLDLLRSESTHPQASMSDVSEWMRRLFELSIAQKRGSLRDAAQAARAASLAGHGQLAARDRHDADDAATCVAARVPLKRLPAVSAPSLSAGSPVPSRARRSESGTLKAVAYEPPAPSTHSTAAGWLTGGTFGALLVAAMVLLVAGPKHFTAAEAAARLDLLAKAVTAGQPVSTRRVFARAPVASSRPVLAPVSVASSPVAARAPSAANLTVADEKPAHAQPVQQLAQEPIAASIDHQEEPTVALDAATRHVTQRLGSRSPGRHVRPRAAPHAGIQSKPKGRRVRSPG